MLSTWDALDILVNNAGTNIRKPSLEFTDDEYRAILDTNMTSAWELTRLAASEADGLRPGRHCQRRLCRGQHAVGTGAVYAMTKAALAHLTRYLAWNGRGTASA